MDIQFDGTFSKEDYKSSVKLLNSSITKKPGLNIDIWIVLVVIGIGMMLWGFRTMFVELDLNSGTFIIAFGLVILVYGVKTRTAIDKAWEEINKNTTKFEGTITEEFLDIRSSNSETKILWAAFSGYGAYKQVIVLIHNNQGQIFSRSMFKNEEDWIQFQKLVSQKLNVIFKVQKPRLSNLAIIYIIINVLFVALVLISLHKNGAR
ncbi:MAG: hypothetical protein H6635_03550 [Anaerolineales bacterium]|nr:hypothetical protein [Anaerolineales bacterium]MCB9144420.1 hypothetical protein [Anaerolineales bacterium]